MSSVAERISRLGPTPTPLIARVSGLRKLLDDEYDLLKEERFDALEDLQTTKRELLEELEDSPVDASGAEDELPTLLEACRQQNIVNGALMHQLLRIRQPLLGLLSGHGTPAEGLDAYEADGSPATPESARSFGRA